MVRFEKPKKSGRPEFVHGRIAELHRQLATETKETRRATCKMKLMGGDALIAD
jgi:hypothetical protein